MNQVKLDQYGWYPHVLSPQDLSFWTRVTKTAKLMTSPNRSEARAARHMFEGLLKNNPTGYLPPWVRKEYPESKEIFDRFLGKQLSKRKTAGYINYGKKTAALIKTLQYAGLCRVHLSLDQLVQLTGLTPTGVRSGISTQVYGRGWSRKDICREVRDKRKRKGYERRNATRWAHLRSTVYAIPHYAHRQLEYKPAEVRLPPA